MPDAYSMTAQKTELSAQDFRAAILKMLQWAITNSLETDEKRASAKK